MCCSKVVCSKRRTLDSDSDGYNGRIWAARHLFAIASMYSVYIVLSRSLM